ncbi:protein YSC84 [Drosophila ficusphila]|uniref:protein YSC84 n=1 Tax=Drosophila ficusphila TaxID=30025 RepID=UPI0007E74800|nr:protein YSC84 [Drosophila ficusphila]XP_017039997.1 protein YSC84 [Drosophila ficusphila]
MTIPSRPAPAPPGSRGQCAAAGANASLEQLRLQLQQQHMQQQQAAGGGLQKLTIKLPPPPKGPLQPQNSQHKRTINNNNGSLFDEPTGGSSITRKFPQARYTPATNWDDDPFGGNGNDRFKKMPPPRPPPPKVLVNGQNMTKTSSSTASAAAGGGSLISNIFHRKKSTATASAAANKAAAQSRVYGLSSGNVGPPHHSSSSVSSNGYSNSNSSASSAAFSNSDWNAAWNTATTTTTTTSSSSHYASQQTADAQLISFDSPPSSPTFTQKSNSDCVSVDSFSSDSNFSSPNNGSVSQPESGFEDDYHRSRPSTQSPQDPWEAVDSTGLGGVDCFGSAPVRQTYQLQARSSDNPLCNGKSLLPPTQSLTMPTIIKPKISQKPKAPKPPPFIGGVPPGYSIPAGYAGSETPPSPPMPKGPPPPLPNGGISLLDVISGKVDALALSNGCQGYIEEEVIPYAIALYDFDGVEEGDLSFREGEKLYLLDHPTPEWMRGRTRSGCEGIFPVNYVDIKVPLGATGGGAAAISNSAAAPTSSSSQQQLPTALCLYHFPGGVEGDLVLQENELVTVLYRINDDWLYGEVAGRQGQFPANFLDQVPANLPTL